MIRRLNNLLWEAQRSAKDWIWWFRHRLDPRHRYHVVSTGLRPGYYDPDLRLICAFFNETARFVERTRDLICWDGDDGHQEAWAAFTAAAEWWKVHGAGLFDNFDTEAEEWQECKRHMMAVTEHLRCMWYP